MLKDFIRTFYSEFKNEGKFSNLYAGMSGALRNYKRSNSELWANTLCYLTILSIVPLLAILFGIGAWLGIDDYIKTQLYTFSPLNEESLDILLSAANNFVFHSKNTLIFGLGGITFIYVIIAMFSNIEKAFNNIWRVKKTRRLRAKFADYSLIIILFPIILLVMYILGGKSSQISSIPKYITVLAPYISLWIFFLTFYKILPNTYVRFTPCFISSFFISILLNQSNFAFIKLQIIIATYNQIYGNFSVILIFLIWIKIIWFLILLGSHLTYILQNIYTLSYLDGIKYLNFNSKFNLSLVVMKRLIKNFLENEEPITSATISSDTSIPYEMVIDILYGFKDMGFITEIEDGLQSSKTFKLSFNFIEMTVGDFYNRLLNYGDNYSRTNIQQYTGDTNKKLVDII